MKKSNIKRILSGLFAMLMVCCIAFTTQGLTVNAAIVSGGKKNYSYKELKTDLKQEEAVRLLRERITSSREIGLKVIVPAKLIVRGSADRVK